LANGIKAGRDAGRNGGRGAWRKRRDDKVCFCTLALDRIVLERPLAIVKRDE
jgi:hypothetical protein